MILSRCMGYMRIVFISFFNMVVFVVSHGAFMDLTCLDHMEELHLVIIAHSIYERVIIRLHFLKTPYLIGACMASHLDHLFYSSCMV